ncbi:MAG: NAD-dependent epimerase/dehydratase family protein [Myxococcota bacterium]
MKILVTGASSFVGAHFATLAHQQGFDVLALWRDTPLYLEGPKVIVGDVRDIEPVGVDAVVHLAAKVMADDAREQNRSMLDAILKWRVPIVYCSSTAVHWPVKSAYAESRIEDEQRVRESGLNWLIVRPCAPYGPPHATHRPAHVESFHRLQRLAKKAPMVPVLGDGTTKRQPVHVDDFNGAICALLQKGVWNEAFDAGGPEPLTLKQIIDALAGREKPLFKIPVGAAGALGRILPGFHPDVLKTFAQDDTVDPRPLREASGVVPRVFSGDF